MKDIKFFKRAFCVALAGVTVLSVLAFAVEDESATAETQVEAVTVAQEPAIPAQDASQAVYFTDINNLELIATSGLIEIYFDPVSYSVAVKDTSKGKVWTQLPTEQSEKDVHPCVIGAKVYYDGGIYSLNSQDNCVSLSKATYEKTENGLNVTYNMAYKADNGKDIELSLTVSYYLVDGSFFAEMDCSKTELTDKAVLLGIDFMKYFGANIKADVNDFILVPDGVGAIVKTGNSEGSFSSIDLVVYGGSVNGNTQGNKAVIPAFGMRQGASAFAAIIQQGDALATVNAQKATGGDDGYNMVGVNFTVTESDGESNVAKASYSGLLQICYRFISGNNSSYVGMAVVCREQMIRTGVLSTKSVDSENEYLPLNLSVVGQTYGSKKILGVFRNNMKLTTFEQATDLAMLLKAKGINNIALRYIGAMSGGTDQRSILDAKILGSLGGKGNFNDLYDYLLSQKSELYLDVNLISSSDFSGGETAKNLLGKKSEVNGVDRIQLTFGVDSVTKKFLKFTKIDKALSKLFDNTDKLDITGYCLNDAGAFLYADYKKGVTRQEVMQKLSTQSMTASMNRKLMISGGNFYAVKNADSVVDLDFSTSVEESADYCGVPFVPAIFHGIFDYSPTPVNMSEDFETAFLKSVEYGACPSFELVYNSNDKYDFSSLYYENWMSFISESYKKANSALGDLRDYKISAHYAVQDGVYCTEFNNGSLIYVNYTDSSVAIGKFSVPAKDFIRIN